MTTFSMTTAEVEAEGSTYGLMMALEQFWRANGMRSQNLTNEERIREALHWASKTEAA